MGKGPRPEEDNGLGSLLMGLNSRILAAAMFRPLGSADCDRKRSSAAKSSWCGGDGGSCWYVNKECVWSDVS
jgi:hypothetical protein